MPYNNAGAGLVKALLGIVVFVALLGALATFGMIDGNTVIDQAEAAKIQADTAYYAQLQQLELPFKQAELEQQVAIATAENEAQLARIEADKQAYLANLTEEHRLEVENNKLKLVMKERLQIAGLSLTFLLGSALIILVSITLAKFLLSFADRISRSLVAVQRDPIQYDPEYRRWRIGQARQQESLSRVRNWESERNGVNHRNGNGRSSIRA